MTDEITHVVCPCMLYAAAAQKCTCPQPQDFGGHMPFPPLPSPMQLTTVVRTSPPDYKSQELSI